MTALLHIGVASCFVTVILAFLGARRSDRGLFAAARLAAATSVVFSATFLMRVGVATGRFPVTGPGEFAILLASALLLVGLAIDLLRGAPIVTVCTSPLALITLIIAIALGPTAGSQETKVATIWSGLHVMAVLVAFLGFVVAFVCGFLYLIEQRQLKSRPAPSLLGLMPSLDTLYALTIAGIAVGVTLLTAGVLVGYLYARRVETTYWRTDPKVILTTATWLAYLLVLALSRIPSLRGRRTAWAAVVCFVLVVITFWTTPFWSSFHSLR